MSYEEFRMSLLNNLKVLTKDLLVIFKYLIDCDKFHRFNSNKLIVYESSILRNIEDKQIYI